MNPEEWYQITQFFALAKTIDLNYFAEWLLVTKKILTQKK